jgi:hypothetical protein
VQRVADRLKVVDARGRLARPVPCHSWAGGEAVRGVSGAVQRGDLVCHAHRVPAGGAAQRREMTPIIR